MPTLLYSGNLGMGQDLGTVLRAVAQLSGRGNVYVRIVGGGKGLSQVKKISAELGLTQVEFCPPVPLYELPGLLASGDIHVICQKLGTEGLLVPSKVYGTLATGRPILFIGPEESEIGRIVRDGACGFIVQPGAVDRAKEVIAQLTDSADLREEMGTRARAYYESHFGRKRSVSRIIDILESVGNDGHN